MRNSVQIMRITYCEHDHCARRATCYSIHLGGYRCDDHEYAVEATILKGGWDGKAIIR